jgi:hypothetical protein
MSAAPSFPHALARLRDVFAFYHQSPTIAANALELEDCTYDAARAALAARISFAALCSELGRAATESFPQDPAAAIGLGQAMTRLAAHVYERRAAS